MRNNLIAALLVLSAPSALALESEATLPAQFNWIIPDEVRQQYPNENLSLAIYHFIPEIQVTTNPRGIFEVRVTMPTTLTAGETVQTTYLHQSTTDGEMLFVNPENSEDYLKCYERDSWVNVRCTDVTLKGVSAVDAAARRAYAESRYAGTRSSTPMAVVAGAEPGGAIEFRDPQYEDVAPTLGEWRYEYTTSEGQRVTGTMILDGYSGIYRADGSNATGLLSNFAYSPGTLNFDWVSSGDIYGWAEFVVTPGRLEGSYFQYEGDGYGTWTAVKQ